MASSTGHRGLAEVDAGVRAGSDARSGILACGRARCTTLVCSRRRMNPRRTPSSLNPAVERAGTHLGRVGDLLGGHFEEAREGGEEMMKEAETRDLKNVSSERRCSTSVSESSAATLLASVKRGEPARRAVAGRTGRRAWLNLGRSVRPGGYRPNDPRPLHGPSRGVQPRRRVCAARRPAEASAGCDTRSMTAFHVIRGSREIRCSNRFGVMRATSI